MSHLGLGKLNSDMRNRIWYDIMASVLREGVPTVAQFQAWDFVESDAIFLTCFLNTMMRDYGTMMPKKLDMKARMTEYNCSRTRADMLARAYRRLGNRPYGRMVQGLAVSEMAKNTKDGRARPGLFVIHPGLMELIASKENVNEHFAKRANRLMRDL